MRFEVGQIAFEVGHSYDLHWLYAGAKETGFKELLALVAFAPLTRTGTKILGPDSCQQVRVIPESGKTVGFAHTHQRLLASGLAGNRCSPAAKPRVPPLTVRVQ